MALQDRYTATFQGNVQGVGFRYACVSLARTWPFRGYVRNLDDGRVKLLCQGRKRDIQAFLRKLNDRLERYIAERVEEWSTSEEDPGPFRIVYSEDDGA